MNPTKATQRWEDWSVIVSLLPQGWEAQARRLGALRRARGVTDATTLLRVLLTDVKGGETFRRIPVRRGDVMMGDWKHASGVDNVRYPSTRWRQPVMS